MTEINRRYYEEARPLGTYKMILCTPITIDKRFNGSFLTIRAYVMRNGPQIIDKNCKPKCTNLIYFQL